MRKDVAQGIALLNEKFPDWTSHVDLETFHLDDENHCVLAQVTGKRFDEAVYVIFPCDEQQNDPSAYCLAVTHGFNPSFYDFGATESEWISYLKEHQAAS